MRACIKFGGNLMHVSGFLSGGFLMGVEAFHFEWELHPHECGRGGGSPMAGSMPLGCPLSLIKGPLSSSQSTPPREGSISPPLEFPHGLGSARYMFSVAFSGRICCFRCFAGARARRLSGYPDVCVITDSPLLCGAGRDGAGPAGPDGCHHDLEIGKRSTTSSTSTTSLTLFGWTRCIVWIYIHPFLVFSR